MCEKLQFYLLNIHYELVMFSEHNFFRTLDLSQSQNPQLGINKLLDLLNRKPKFQANSCAEIPRTTFVMGNIFMLIRVSFLALAWTGWAQL